MTHHRKPRGWAAVPGTTEKAPVIEIVIFVAVCIGLLVGAAVMLTSLAVSAASLFF